MEIHYVVGVTIPRRGNMSRGMTPNELAEYLRVSPDKVRSWIRKGELRAINTASVLCGKPRWVITPESLAEFEKRRTSVRPPQPPKRKRMPANYVDYFPDM